MFIHQIIHMLSICVTDYVRGSQSDREKSEGLPVAPFMDREKVTKPTAQIGFIKFVLIPMFETVMKVSVKDGDEGQSTKLKISPTSREVKNVDASKLACCSDVDIRPKSQANVIHP